jgi:AAA domain-containing protein
VVVVIDTLNRALNGDENKPEDMGKFIRTADAIREALGCAAVVVHHCGVDATRPRGHPSLMGALDVLIAVERDAGQHVIAKVERMKGGEAGATVVSDLERVELGQDDDGDPISSLVIVPAEGAAVARKPALADGVKLALDALKSAVADAGERPPASNHIPQQGDIRVVSCDLWRRYFYAVKDGEGDTQKKAFKRARERLQALGLIGVWNDLVWLGDIRDIGGRQGDMSPRA